jgi:arylsulfatase A-like enzyme
MGEQTFSREFAAKLPIEDSRAMYLANRASDFISTNKDRPFMMCVGILEPHPPYENALSDIHDPSDITFEKAFMQSPGKNSSKLNQSRETEVPSNIKTEADWRELKAKYWGNVSMVDRAVEKIIKTLRSTEIDDRTIVILTSEHGDQMGDHNILQKSVLYEESIRVPLLVKVPWLESSGKKMKGRFSLSDLVPTMLDLMGADIPDQLHGRSRVPVMVGTESLDDNNVVVEWNGRNLEPSANGVEFDKVQNQTKRAFISSDGWKLIVGLEDKNELFDLNSDPQELINLIDLKQHKKRAKQLLRKLSDWQKTVDDKMRLPTAADL